MRAGSDAGAMRRLFAVVIVWLSVPAFAGTETLLSEVKAALDAFRAEFGTQWVVETTPDGLHVASLTGFPKTGVVVSEDGRELIDAIKRIAGTGPADKVAKEPVAGRMGAMIFYRYPQVLGGAPVRDADVRVQIPYPGGPYDILIRLFPPQQMPPAIRSREDAVEIVEQRLAVEKAFSGAVRRIESAVGRELIFDPVAVNPETELVLIGRKVHRVYRARGQAHVLRGEQRVTLRAAEFLVDATDAVPPIVGERNLLNEYHQGVGLVFNPNPVNALNNWRVAIGQLPFMTPPYAKAVLQDLNDASPANATLNGRYVSIESLEGAASGSPSAPVKLGLADFTRPRGDYTFAAVTTYFMIDTMQRYLAGLVYFGDLIREPLPVDVYDIETLRPWGYYAEDKTHPGEGFLRFSMVDNGSEDYFTAEDGDAVAHEYAHAVLARKTAGRFSDAETIKLVKEAEPVNEGFADYWALTSTLPQTLAHGFAIDCLEEWANIKNGTCLRYYTRIPSYKSFDSGLGPHTTGQIWSGTLYDVLKLYKFDRKESDAVVLQGHLNRAFHGLAPTMKEMAEGIIIADAGRNTKALCDLFASHDLPALDCCTQKGCVP
jgi:hypothetical protein